MIIVFEIAWFLGAKAPLEIVTRKFATAIFAMTWAISDTFGHVRSRMLR